MFKSLLLVAFVGIVAVNAVELAPQKDAWGFIVDNIIDPFVETVIDNTVNLITGAILGLFGKRDAWGFIVDNIIDPFVETVIDNTVNLITGAILGLFGKRDAWGFIVDNIIDPFVETVIDNTVNLITGAILGLFGKRDAWGFIVDNIIDPFVETVIDNTVNLITGAILGLFGKRGLDFTQLIVPIIQQFVPSLVQGITSAINHLITALLPLARQQIYHLPGHPVSIGIADALYEFSNELKVNSHLFLSSVVQVAQQILSTIQLNSLVNVLQHVVNQINSLVQFIAPIVNAVFALLANPVVSNLLGQIIG